MTTIKPLDSISIIELSSQSNSLTAKHPNSIMPDCSEKDYKSMAKTLADRLASAVKKNNSSEIMNCINELIKANNSDLITYMVTEFAKSEDKSMAYTLLQYSKTNPEIREAVTTIKNICEPETSGYNDFLAVDLFNACNGSDKEKTANAVNDITHINVRNVEWFYRTISSQTGEKAATNAEEKYLPKDTGLKEKVKYYLRKITGDVKINALAQESPIQGILNQVDIPLSDRAVMLKNVLDKYIQNAENDPSIPREKIEAFRKEVFGPTGDGEIPFFQDATDDAESLASQTAWYIECALDKLYDHSK